MVFCKIHNIKSNHHLDIIKFTKDALTIQDSHLSTKLHHVHKYPDGDVAHLCGPPCLISLLLQSSGIAANADSKYAEYQDKPKVHNHRISVALRV